MSRRQDPIVRVLDFFENQPIEAADLAFAIVRDTMRRRHAGDKKPIRRKRAKPATTPTPDAAAIALGASAAPEAEPAAAPSPTPVRPRRRRAASTTAATDTTAVPAGSVGSVEHDLALPGLGPATVGE